MTQDDDEVLGKLPRSRPGRRSPRRAEDPQGGDEPTGPGGARTPPGEHGPPLATDADIESAAGGDPLSGAVRAVSNVALTGVRAAGRITGGILRRLPRR